MAVSKSQQKAVNKYVREKYDRINITMQKGKKDTLQAHAEAQGQSVNAYINTAIDERMSREAVGTPARPTDAMTSKNIAEDENAVLSPSESRTEGIAE